MNPLLSVLVHVVLMPPVSLLLLMLAGSVLMRWRPRAGRIVRNTGAIALLVLSTGAGAMLLVAPLENMTAPLRAARDSGAQAIVVLAAGRTEAARDYGGADVPDDIALLRLRYAARLQHETGLPLLASGGNAAPDREAKAASMARALREDFRTPVQWVEGRSSTTQENAAFSAAMLKPAGVRRVLLVTHAMHMARASAAFKAAGLEVVEAPTMFYSSRLAALMFVPSAGGMQRSYYASYEWVGLAWYRLRLLSESR